MIIAKSKRLIWRSLLILVPLVIYLVSSYLTTILQLDRTATHVFSFSETSMPEVIDQLNLPKDSKLKKIVVTGFFSDWRVDDPAYHLKKTNTGDWHKEFRLPVGEVQYKMVMSFANDNNDYWLTDPSNKDVVNDSFGGFNSVLDIPDYQSYLALFKVSSLVVFAFSIAYIILQKMLNWLLLKRMPVARKVVFGSLSILLLSNVLLLFYQISEYRFFVRQGVIDSVHTLHLSLIQQGIQPNEFNDKDKIAKSLNAIMWEAKTRVEKNQRSAAQVTISDIAILNTDYVLVHAQARQQNAELQKRRANQSGFTNTAQYYEFGIFGDAIEKAKEKTVFSSVIADPTAEVIAIETPQTFWSRQFLGFSNVIIPIEINGKNRGYYAAAIQVKLYGNEIRRAIAINILLIAIILLLSYTLFASVAEVFTRNLTRLTDWTRRINEGDFSGMVTLKTKDEAQDLAENFAIMQTSLQQSFAKIKEQNEQLNKAAYTDITTGLGNRNKLMNELINDSSQHVILYELIDYEKLQSFLGEEFTAKVMTHVRDYLLPILDSHPKSALFRINNNQLVVLAANIDQKQLTSMVDQLIDAVNHAALTINQLTLNLSAVVGVCTTEYTTSEPSECIDKASQALLFAKSKNEKRRFYQPSMQQKRDLAKNISTINRIRDALQKDKLVPFFQPIVDSNSTEIIAYECLARIIESPNHILPPNEFLPAAKHSGLYQSISQTMFEKSAAICRRMGISITLNLSALDIEGYQSKQFLNYWLTHNQDILHRVTFEITETEKIEDYAMTKEFVDMVSEKGCKVALDDFGAGYSNFTHLLSLNIDYIKIDGSLIKNIDTDPNSQMITKAIIECAKALNVKTVAEYVHSQKIHEYLINLDVDYCQGYYFGVPSQTPVNH